MKSYCIHSQKIPIPYCFESFQTQLFQFHISEAQCKSVQRKISATIFVKLLPATFKGGFSGNLKIILINAYQQRFHFTVFQNVRKPVTYT